MRERLTIDSDCRRIYLPDQDCFETKRNVDNVFNYINIRYNIIFY